MAWSWVLLALVLAALGVKQLFRWRTWRDRGLLVLGACTLAAPFLWTAAGAVAHDMLAACVRIPGGSLLVPAVAFLIGLSGFNPILPALCFAAARPDAGLAWSFVLPMLLGNLPQTLFCAFTMPPRRNVPPSAAAP